jgi:hypothetical protein
MELIEAMTEIVELVIESSNIDIQEASLEHLTESSIHKLI